MNPLVRRVARLYASFTTVIVAVTVVALAQQPPPAPAPPPTPTPPESMEWFAGNWEINYQDTQLGSVHGLAMVRVENDGNVLIRYIVTDPRDGASHELTPFHIRHAAGVLTMELSPGGPVAELDTEGAPVPSAADDNANIINAPGGARLRATLDGKESEAPVVPASSRLSTRLRLLREADKLVGEWQIVRNRESGFRGSRCGKRDTLVSNLPASVGEFLEEIMRGPETWQSARMVVEDTRRVDWRDAPAAGEIAGTASLTINGKNMPEPRRREVRFADPYLRADNTKLTGTLPTAIAKRAVPGPKTFTLKDRETSQEAPGLWLFDWPALPVKNIHHARRTAGGDFEPTSTLYFGELFFVEVEIARAVPGDLRLYTIQTDAEEPVSFHLKRDPSKRTLFRAGPFLLLGLKGEAAGGAVSAPALSINQSSITAPDAAHPFIVRASRGTYLRTAPHSTQLGEPLAAAFAEAKEDNSEDGPYQRALRKAEDFHRRFPDPDRYNISKFTPMSGSRRTQITVQDHAALILLHGELLRNMDSLRRQHSRELSANERASLRTALMEASEQRVDLPIFYYDVADADGKGTTRLNAAAYPNNLRQAFGNDTAKRDAYLDGVIAEAGRKMTDHAATGAARISQADISRPESLLPSIKSGYASASASVMQRLVRRSRPANGEPAVPRWVTDEVGRAAVRGVPDLLGAIQADEQLADMQWGAIQLMTAPLAIYTGALGAAGMLTRGALALNAASDLVMAAGAVQNMVRLNGATDLRDTAWAAAPVAGYETFRAARDEVSSRRLIAAVDVPLTLLGAAGLTRDAIKLGVRSSSQAARAAVLGAATNGVESLSDGARAQFAMVLDSAARKAAGGGLDSLTDIERAALRANFPDGIPSNVAKELNIPPTDPNFVIRVGDSTLAGAASKRPPDPVLPSAAPAVAPEASTNPLIRRLYEENLSNARLGVPEAQGRLERLKSAAARWEQLPEKARGTATEAMETFIRLRREKPALADLNEAEALEYFNLHSGARVGGDAHRAVLPEEIAAEFARWKNKPLGASELAKAANISEDNAEAALVGARHRLPDDIGPLPTPRPKADPGAITVTNPPPPSPLPVTLPPATPREAEIAQHLQRMGLPPAQAQVAATVPAVRAADAKVGAAHAAMMQGVPSKTVREALGMTPAELRAGLDDYLRRFDPAGEAERGRLLDRFMGENVTAIEPRRVPLQPTTQANFPRGLAPQPQAPAAARNDVLAALDRMGVPRAETEILTPQDIFPRTGGLDARAAAAAMARKLNVPAPRAASALGITETEYAGLLDRAEALAQPGLTPSQRAASVASDLRSDGVTQPFSRVLDARQSQVDAALRDVGIPHGDGSLVRAGLDPESALVGQALENGVPAAEIAARRGLTPERVEALADEFLRDGRNVSDAAERTRQRTELLQRSPLEPGPNAPTVRLSPRVLATQEEVASALERVGVDPFIAGERGSQLANVARRDAHEAIIGGAWQSRVPPAALRQQFGYTDDQIARGLDAFLENQIGMRDPAARANFIARNYFTLNGQPMDAAAVRAMAGGAQPPRQPLRALSAAASAPPLPPSPPEPPVAFNPIDDLDHQFGLPRAPTGSRPGELTASGAWRPNAAVTEIRPGAPPRLNPALRYNWLVDQRGRVLAAPEQFIIENNLPLLDERGVGLRMGHPTIINGGPARIAGELNYVEGRGWVLNNLSGRYCLLKPDMNRRHLNNVADIFEQAGLRVQRDYH